MNKDIGKDYIIPQIPNPYLITAKQISKRTKQLSRDREFREEYRHEFEERPERIRGTRPMVDTPKHTNLCVKGAMFKCNAILTTVSGDSKWECQKTCTYYEKATNHNRCIFEVFETYCWNTKAQDNA